MASAGDPTRCPALPTVGKIMTGKGFIIEKSGCPDIHLTWEHAAKRVAALVQNNRYLPAEAQAAADKVREGNALAEQEEMAAPSVPEGKTGHAVPPVMPQTTGGKSI